MSAATRAPGADKPGNIEYIVESSRKDARETWLVMRADASGARAVVEAASLRPIGVIERRTPPPNRPAGFNPYFDPR